GAIRVRSEFHVQVGRPAAGFARSSSPLYAAPEAAEYLSSDGLIEAGNERISARARALTAAAGTPGNTLDTAQALFRFVEQKIGNEVRFDGPPVSARGCLDAGVGDRAARCRLLVALLRNRNIPARMVTGVTLGKGAEQQAHYWVEAYIYEHWTPMCPYYRLFGRLPATYLIFGFGDRPLITARRITNLKYAFLVERLGREQAEGDEEESAWRRTFKSLSLYMLPPGDRRLVEVLLLLPLAALIICIFRNIV